MVQKVRIYLLLWFFTLLSVSYGATANDDDEFIPKLQNIRNGQGMEFNYLEVSYALGIPAFIRENPSLMVGACHCSRFIFISKNVTDSGLLQKMSFSELFSHHFHCSPMNLDSLIIQAPPLKKNGLYLVDVKVILLNGVLESRTSLMSLYAHYDFALGEIDIEPEEKGIDYSIQPRMGTFASSFDWKDKTSESINFFKQLFVKESTGVGAGTGVGDGTVSTVTSSTVMDNIKELQKLLLEDHTTQSDWMAYCQYVMLQNNMWKCQSPTTQMVHHNSTFSSDNRNSNNGDLVSPKVDESGGWCLEISQQFIPLPDGTQYMLPKEHLPADPGLVNKLGDLLQHNSVLDVGAGVGQYGRYFKATHAAIDYTGIDGALNVEEYTGGFVKWRDLTLPWVVGKFDWVISFEVAEHIPPQYEHIFVDTLHRHNRKGIILSWAVPGQPGLGHVNCRSKEYTQAVFANLSYYVDQTATKQLRAIATYPYLNNQMFVFRRNDLQQS